MRRAIRPALLIVIAAALGGCGRSVAYYRAHARDRADKVEACLTDPPPPPPPPPPPAAADSRDCRNATQADLEAGGIPAVDGRAVHPGPAGR